LAVAKSLLKINNETKNLNQPVRNFKKKK